MVDWCRDNNLILNIKKIKEMITDLRKKWPSHSPLISDNKSVEVVSSIKLLEVQLTDS